ncbi:hypothetical protein BGX34_000954, partial [Mortierella sp. NVP85]
RLHHNLGRIVTYSVIDEDNQTAHPRSHEAKVFKPAYEKDGITTADLSLRGLRDDRAGKAFKDK